MCEREREREREREGSGKVIHVKGTCKWALFEFVVSSSAIQIIAVDPIGSILAEPEHLNEGGEGFPYQVRERKRERGGVYERERKKRSEWRGVMREREKEREGGGVYVYKLIISHQNLSLAASRWRVSDTTSSPLCLIARWWTSGTRAPTKSRLNTPGC